MSLGYVIGESKPTFVTALTSRPLSVGEYIIIDTQEGNKDPPFVTNPFTFIKK